MPQQLTSTNSTKKNILRFTLAACYLAEYGILISLMAATANKESSFLQIAIYFLYSVPAVLINFFGPALRKMFLSPIGITTVILLASALNAGMMSVTGNAIIIIAGTLIFAFCKNIVKLLVYTHIQNSYPTGERSQLLSDLVALRYTLMIAGASLAGWLSEKQSVAVSFQVHAFVMMAAAVSMMFYKSKSQISEPQIPENALQEKTVSILQSIKGISEVKILFGNTLFYSVCFYYISMGCFMAIEYPLLTQGLSVQPSKIGITYLGHIFGALGAHRLAQYALKSNKAYRSTLALNLLLPLTFAAVGFPFLNLFWISGQLGIVALTMTLSEMLFGSLLMERSSSEQYPYHSSSLEALNAIASILGSAVPLFIPVALSLTSFNVATQITIAASTLAIMVLMKIKRRIA